MYNDDDNVNISCSFCGKSQDQVDKVIAGPGVYICDECINLSKDIIDNDYAITESTEFEDVPKPQEIYNVLQEYVGFIFLYPIINFLRFRNFFKFR